MGSASSRILSLIAQILLYILTKVISITSTYMKKHLSIPLISNVSIILAHSRH